MGESSNLPKGTVATATQTNAQTLNSKALTKEARGKTTSRRIGIKTIHSIGAGGCVIKIRVLVDSTPSTKHAVIIDDKNYHNGKSFIIAKADHTLSWLSENGVVFDTWAVSDNIAVEDETAETTTLTVLCGGTLTLNLAACPSGEQITNGGFETGDFTGWVPSNVFIATDYVHSGTYSVNIYAGTLYQDVNIHQGCVTSFGFWSINPTSPPGLVCGYARVYYSDATYTQITITSTADWVYHDLLPLLAEGKRVVRIYFEGSTARPCWIDDASLVGS